MAKRARTRTATCQVLGPILGWALSCGAVACGDDSETVTEAASTGTMMCMSNLGTLSGKVREEAATGPGAPMAIVSVRRPSDLVPIQLMADNMGNYGIDLEAGSWVVSAEFQGSCVTFAEETVDVTPCKVTSLSLEVVCGGGGGGGANAVGAAGSGGSGGP